MPPNTTLLPNPGLFISYFLGPVTHHGPWSQTMEDRPFPMVQLPWSSFLIKSICWAFGLLARCKPNVDQEGWPCIKKWMCWFVKVVEKWQFWKKNKEKNLKFKFDPSLVFVFSSPTKNSWKNSLWLLFLCHGPLSFSTRAPLLPLPPQNPLDHVSGECEP